LIIDANRRFALLNSLRSALGKLIKIKVDIKLLTT
jgi:hypothetical protein